MLNRDRATNGGGPGADTTPDTNQQIIETEQVATVYDLISEGEIEGLVNGAASVYLDGTPLVNESESLTAGALNGSYAARDITGPSTTFDLADTPVDLTTIDMTSGTRYLYLERTQFGTGDAPSGSNSKREFSDAESPFVASDVGRLITIVGAGVNGGNVTTKIVSVPFPNLIYVKDDFIPAPGAALRDYYMSKLSTITSIDSATGVVVDGTHEFGTTYSPWIITAPIAAQTTEVDGVRNFESASFFFRTGAINQPLPPQDGGIKGTAFAGSVNEEILQTTRTGTYPVTGQDNLIKNASTDLGIADPGEIDTIKLAFQFPAMIIIQDEGEKKPSAVEFQIYFEYLRNNTWSNSDGDAVNTATTVPLFGMSDQDIIDRDAKSNNTQEKVDLWAVRQRNVESSAIIRNQTSTEFTAEFTFDIEKYKPFDNWRIRVKRVTGNEAVLKNSSNGQNRSFLTSIFAYISDKLTYPLSAYAGISVQSKEFNNIPARAYLCRGLKIQIPTNYVTREESPTGQAEYTRDVSTGLYTSVDQYWDGNFRGDKSTYTSATDVNYNLTYCNNPAWIYYDIMTNNRYGLGDYLEAQNINKFELYRIARYCDELVPDGQGGTEPRFTANIYLSEASQAYKVLSDMASIFRGILLWVDGQFSVNQDSPKSPVYTFTQGNVLNGQFSYETSSVRQRTNQVVVTWNDPNNFYKQTAEIVEDSESIAETSKIIKKDVIAFGCTSQGQANRLGKWIILTERMESRFVKFTTAINAGFLRPGEIISVQDQSETNIVGSGRVSANSSSTSGLVRLDRTVVIEASDSYTLSVVYPGEAAYLQQEEVVINSVTYYQGDRIASAYQPPGGPPGLVAIDTELRASNATDDSGDLIALSWFPLSRVETQPVNSGAGNYDVLSVSPSFSGAPAADAIWALSNTTDENSNKQTKEFRILSIRENDNLTYDIAGHEYSPEKFAAIDRGYEVTTPTNSPVPLFGGTVPPVSSVRVFPQPETDGAIDEESSSSSTYNIFVDWDMPRNEDKDGVYEYLNYFEIKHNYTEDNSYITRRIGNSGSHLIKSPVVFGTHSVYVRTVDTRGRKSKWVGTTVDESELTTSGVLKVFKILGLKTQGSLSTGVTMTQSTGFVTFTPEEFNVDNPNGFTNYRIAGSPPTVDFSDVVASSTAYLYWDDSADDFIAVDTYTDTVTLNAVGDPVNKEIFKLTSDLGDGLTDTGVNTGAALTTTVTRQIDGSPQDFTVYPFRITTASDLTSQLVAGDLFKLVDSGSPANSWYGTIQRISTTEIITNEPINKDFASGVDIYKQTFKPDRTRDFIAMVVTTDGSSPPLYFIDSVNSLSGATAGVNLWNSAGDLLEDIDVRNDLLVIDALGAMNANPSFSIPRPGVLGSPSPSSWFGYDSAEQAQYYDTVNQDGIYIPSNSYLYYANTAMSANLTTKYEVSLLAWNVSGIISPTLKVWIDWTSDNLALGEKVVTDYTLDVSPAPAGQDPTSVFHTTNTDTIKIIDTTVTITPTVYTALFELPSTSPPPKWFSINIGMSGPTDNDMIVDWCVLRDASTFGATVDTNLYDNEGNILTDVDVRNPLNMNLLLDPTNAINNTQWWTVGLAGVKFQNEYGTGWTWPTFTGTTQVLMYSPTGTDGIPVAPSTEYALYMDIRRNSYTSGAIYADIIWYNSSGTLVLDGGSLLNGAHSTTWERKGGVETSPPTAAYASVRVVTSAFQGSDVEVKRLKFELSPVSAYTDDTASGATIGAPTGTTVGGGVDGTGGVPAEDVSGTIDSSGSLADVVAEDGGGTYRGVVRGLFNGLAEDGETITFSTAWGNTPSVMFLPGGKTNGSTLTGDTYQDFKAINITTEDFDAYLKLSETVGATALQTETGSDTGSPASPLLYDINKGQTADEAYDLNYTYQVDLSIANFFNVDEGGGYWQNSTLTVGFWYNNGGSYVLGGTKTYSSNAADAGTPTTRLNEQFTLAISGMGLNEDWAVSIISRGMAESTITSFDQVTYYTANAPTSIDATTDTPGVPFMVLGD